MNVGAALQRASSKKPLPTERQCFLSVPGGIHGNPQHQVQRPLEHDLGNVKMFDHSLYMEHTAIFRETNPQMIRQLETTPIAEGHLNHLAREIYAGLVMEKECIEMIRSLPKIGPRTELSQDQWKTVILLH